MRKGIKTIEAFDDKYFRTGDAFQLISKESGSFKNAILMNCDIDRLTFSVINYSRDYGNQESKTLYFRISDFETTKIKRLIPENDEIVTLNKETLIHYDKLKELVEKKAEEVLKAYYEYKKWDFPSDFSLENVFLSDGKVAINYHAFDSLDDECLPIEYFLTLDSKYLIK